MRKGKSRSPPKRSNGRLPLILACLPTTCKNMDSQGCVSMWKNDLFFQQRKKTFTKAIAAALLKDRKVKIKGMYSTKTGKTFDGVCLLEWYFL